MTSDVPEYATEEGYSITDNICLKPRELEIEAIITNSPVTWAEQHAASSSRVETMIEELRQLWLKKTPVQFTAAGDSYYKEKARESVPVTRPATLRPSHCPSL